MTTALELAPILERLADIVMGTIGLVRVSVNLLDERTNELKVVAVRGEPSSPVGTKLEIDSLKAISQMMSKKTTTRIDYEKRRLSDEERLFIGAYDAKLALLVPIIIDDEAIGVITVDQPGEKHDFTAREMGLVEGIASQAAVAIENARFHERAEVSTRTFQAIAQMGTLIVSTLTMEEAAPQIIDYAMLLLDLPATALLILDKQQQKLRVVASEGIGERPVKATLSFDETASLGLDRPGARLLDLGAFSTTPFFADIKKRGFIAGLLAPIFIEDRLSGYLIGLDKKPLSPSDDDLAAFDLFVNQTATAIMNAERYEAERTIAQTLQEVLLTMPDKVSGIDFGHLYYSATETARVGGDFYDLFELEDEQIAVVMGDVAGKGLEAASLTALVKNSIKAYSFEGISVPEVLDRTNNVVLRNSGDSNFVTVFFGILNKQTGRFIYCSAGHPPPILRKTDGSLMILSVGGPAIGIFTDLPLEQSQILIEPGDTLVLYTDGAIEARRNGTFLGEKGLVRYINKNAGLPIGQMPQAVFKDIIDFTGGTLSDDVAILALELKPTT